MTDMDLGAIGCKGRSRRSLMRDWNNSNKAGNPLSIISCNGTSIMTCGARLNTID